MVVPTHRTRDLTLRCVDVLNAGVPGSSEVIVVDDGSNSDTEVEPTAVERLLHAFDAASRTGDPSGAPAMRPRGCGCSR